MTAPLLARQLPPDALEAARTAVAEGASIRGLARAFNLTRASAWTLVKRYRPAPEAASAPPEPTDTLAMPPDPLADIERLLGRSLR
jgi:hypothetical protein